MSIHLLDDLIDISSSAYDGDINLSSVNGHHSNSLAVFEAFLSQAGFSIIEQEAILFGLSVYRSKEEHVYYNVRKLARTRDVDGLLPLFTVAVNSLMWAEMKHFLAANMTVLHEVDSPTGLPLFKLAAEDNIIILESVYNLLVAYPVFTVR